MLGTLSSEARANQALETVRSVRGMGARFLNKTGLVRDLITARRGHDVERRWWLGQVAAHAPAYDGGDDGSSLVGCGCSPLQVAWSVLRGRPRRNSQAVSAYQRCRRIDFDRLEGMLLISRVGMDNALVEFDPIHKRTDLTALYGHLMNLCVEEAH